MLPLYLMLALGPPCPAPQVAPPPLVAPAPPAVRPHGTRDGEWTWDANGRFWWRVRPVPITFALPKGVGECRT